MYRVYDKKKGCWVKEKFYISPNNDLSMSNMALFGLEKLSLVSDNRYIIHRDIGTKDKNNRCIFEGDICKNCSNDKIGVIAYSTQICSYCLLCYDNKTYYTLGDSFCKDLEIIGNVFDNSDLISIGDE